MTQTSVRDGRALAETFRTSRAWKVPALLAGSNGGVAGLTISLMLAGTLGWGATALAYNLLNEAIKRPDLGSSVGIARQAIIDGADRVGIEATVDDAGFLQLLDREKKGLGVRFDLRLDGGPPADVSIRARLEYVEDGAIHARTDEVVFVVESPGVLGSVGSFTYSLTTPASIHAFERTIEGFFEELKGVQAARNAGLSNDFGIDVEKLLVSSLRGPLGNLPEDLALSRTLNGPIQAATVWVFFFLLIQLASRFLLHYALEERVRRSPKVSWLWTINSKSRAEMVIETTAVHAVQEQVRTKTSLGVTSYRCATLDLYMTAVDAYLVENNYAVVPDFLDKKAGEILDRQSTNQGMARYLVWAIPTIGFVGTVVGIGGALLATIGVDSTSKGTAAIAKSTVSGSIGVAFDTTLVALVLSLIAMFLLHFFGQLEELVVERARRETMDKFLVPGSRIPESQLAQSLVEELRELKEHRDELVEIRTTIRQASSRMNNSNRHQFFVVIALVLLLIAAGFVVVRTLNGPN